MVCVLSQPASGHNAVSIRLCSSSNWGQHPSHPTPWGTCMPKLGTESRKGSQVCYLGQNHFPLHSSGRCSCLSSSFLPPPGHHNTSSFFPFVGSVAGFFFFPFCSCAVSYWWTRLKTAAEQGLNPYVSARSVEPVLRKHDLPAITARPWLQYYIVKNIHHTVFCSRC